MRYEEMDRKQYVRGMFDAIAPRYDLLNRLMTGGLDRGWRRAAVALLTPRPGHVVLDLATGTGDLLGECRRQAGPGLMALGVDFAPQMLMRAARRFRGRSGVRLVRSDIEQLALPADRFDGAVIGFGVRNLGDLPRGLAEIRRVLRPGGKLVILEAARPPCAPVRWAFQWYFERLVPWMGALVARNREAYSYLPWSVRHFPDRDAFLRMMREAGFSEVGLKNMALGTAVLYWGIK